MNAVVPPTNPFSGQPTSWCMKCGRPLKVHEMALRMRDQTAIDYENRGQFYDLIFYFCSDCKEEMLKWYSEGIRGAVERQKLIEDRLKAEDSRR